MQKVTFYTKLNCSLCDKAYQMLLNIACDIPMEIDILDITHTHNNLEAKYAHRIPVIAVDHSEIELEWPFTSQELEAYLSP